jgi:hypothetical protein
MLSIRLLSATHPPKYRAGHEMRTMKRDVQATEARRFEDERSFVFKDGRERLVTLDWKYRLEELRVRSGGRCEMASWLGKRHVPGCSGLAEEPHHIIPRSKQRDDRLKNLAGLSHACHASLDNRKVRSDRAERRANAQTTT